MTNLTKRTAGWVAASLALAALVGVFLVVLAGGFKPGQLAFGQTDNKTTSRGNEAESGVPTVRVKTIRPTREHLKRTTTQAAHVEPFEMAELFAKVAGYLQKVHVDIGDRVKKDQVLVNLWVPEMEKELELKKALVEQAQADVKKYQADRVFREAELARLEKMVKDKSIHEGVLDERGRGPRDAAAAAIASAQAHVMVASREAEYVEALLNYATIKAPYDGVITRRLLHPGAFIQSGATGKAEPLLIIARVDRLRIVTEIPESESAWIKVGQPATLKVDAARGQQFPGKVARLADALDKKSRTMLVEMELDAPTDLLRPGMYGSVTITLADYSDAVLLPTSALLPSADKPAVMIVSDGKAYRQELELGYNNGIRIQITRGLKGVEQVITDGKNTVREGQAVEIAE